MNTGYGISQGAERAFRIFFLHQINNLKTGRDYKKELHSFSQRNILFIVVVVVKETTDQKGEGQAGFFLPILTKE